MCSVTSKFCLYISQSNPTTEGVRCSEFASCYFANSQKFKIFETEISFPIIIVDPENKQEKKVFKIPAI